MAILSPTFNIGGSFAVVVVLSWVYFILAHFEERHILANERKAFALDLGVAVEELDADENLPALQKLLVARFSDERFGNRIADLFGVIRTLWNAVSGLAVYGMLALAVWLTFSDGPTNAPAAWFAVGIWIVAIAGSAALSIVCKVLTGRWPGQPRAARKHLVAYMSSLTAG